MSDFALTLKAGAVCMSSARTDLWRGCPAMGIPTPTTSAAKLPLVGDRREQQVASMPDQILTRIFVGIRNLLDRSASLSEKGEVAVGDLVVGVESERYGIFRIQLRIRFVIRVPGRISAWLCAA